MLIPSSEQARWLMLEGSSAFADMETRGMRVDVPYLEKMYVEIGQKVDEMEQRLHKDDIWKEWRRKHGGDADVGNRRQMGGFIFDYLGIKAKRVTGSGDNATDQDAFEGIDHPFVKTWNDREKLKKTRSTYIRGLLDEQVHGLVRMWFTLNWVITFRSSCRDPNIQNIPARDQRLAKIVRNAFIPRGDGFRLVEVDFSGIEVRAATCYHHDPVMIRYIEDNKDLHKEMAAECFKASLDQVSKGMRGAAKGMFVFAEFYGDWYQKVCQNLWNAVDLDELKLENGSPLRDHLNNVGLRELGDLNSRNVREGTFEAHIRDVEDNFWHGRFPTYTAWKDDWWNSYLRNGYYQMKTGFVSQGIFGKNEVINGPIQGTAFHWNLWVLINLNRWLKENNMQSMLIGQIHDSMILDVHESELQDVLNKIKYLISTALRNHWKWINVPVEAEVSVCDSTWFTKKEWVEIDGIWKEKPKKLAV